jgi:hypothetical protein
VGAETAQTAGFVLLFPLVFASSVFVSVSTLPSWLQPIAKGSRNVGVDATDHDHEFLQMDRAGCAAARVAAT